VTCAREIAARWCYAELTSTRFGASYTSLVSGDIFAKAKSCVSFDELDSTEVDALDKALSSHPDRGPSFYPMLMESAQYEQQEWTITQVEKVVVVPYFGTVPFSCFEKNPHTTVADTLAAIPRGEFHQKKAVIVVRYQGRFMLLEGTLRSVWFARDRNKTTKLKVWVPVS
jgi:hypothetical protein